MIVPDRCLHTIPWRLLRADSDAPYLMDILDITVTAALLSPRHQPPTRPPTAPTAIVIGESEPASDPLERLFLGTPTDRSTDRSEHPERVHRWACLKTSAVFATRWVRGCVRACTKLVHEVVKCVRLTATPATAAVAAATATITITTINCFGHMTTPSAF